MDQLDYKWRINLVKSRFQYLDLTSEQAEKVHRHEEEKIILSEEYFFTEWEDWDYDLHFFKGILSKEQFQLYTQEQKKIIKSYEKSLVESDQPSEVDKEYNKDLTTYYTNVFLPKIFKSDFYKGLSRSSKELNKRQYLKKEYKRFLKDRKKELLTTHFRYCRSYRPNLLEVELLKHQLLYLLPDYAYFKREMGNPTLAVAEYLEKKNQYIIDTDEKFLKDTFQQLNEFNSQLMEKYYGSLDEGDTYIVKGPDKSQSKIRTKQIMAILLLDAE